MTNYILYCI